MHDQNSEIPPVLLGIPWPTLRGPLRNHFWKKKRPQPYWGGENSGNALEPSNHQMPWIIGFWGSQPYSRGEFQETLWERFRGFPEFSGISSGKCQPYWGYGQFKSRTEKHPRKICIKNFGGTLARGSRRGLRRPNSLCRCWFSQQNTVHKEFRGGGSKGV